MAPIAVEDLKVELNREDSFIEPQFSQALADKRHALLSRMEIDDASIPPQFPQPTPSSKHLSVEQLDLKNVTYELLPHDIKEVENALLVFRNRHQQLNHLSTATFPLPTLGPRLRIAAFEVHKGCGVFIIKGLNPDKYSELENVTLYAGIASYIGDKRGTQSGENDVLTHMTAAPKDIADPRPGFMREDLPFHNDYGEILSLYIVEPATSGGNTLISPTDYIYNEIARTKPYLINVLASSSWPHWTARKPNREKYFPLLFPGEQKTPFFGFTRYALTGSQSTPRPVNLQPLTLLQAEALDTVEILARENAIALPQRKGDIQFISNRIFLHARKAYEDASKDSGRHLMRLILMDTELGHPLTAAEQARWGSCFNYPQDHGKWTVGKDLTPNIASASRFDSLFLSEHDTHSNN